MSDLALPFAAGAIAFHCYDSLQLLPGNAVLLLRRARRWSATTGSSLLLAGRHLALPAAWSARAEVFRLYWAESEPRQQPVDVARLDALHAALRPIGGLCMLLSALLWLALPLCAWVYGSGVALLVVVLVYYLLSAIALTLMGLRRRQLGLSRRDCWSLAFDALACAPFAVNLVRRITLRVHVDGEPLATVRELLCGTDLRRAVAEVCARIEAYRDAADGAGTAALNALLERWRGAAP